MALPTKEGRLPFTLDGETYETYYKIIGSLPDSGSDSGSSGGVPLVVLHGGPGSSHDYLLALSDLVSSSSSYSSSSEEENRAPPAVIFYDQLGSGNSTHLRQKPASFWTPEVFMKELANLLRGLGVAGRYDLLGHSWGGMLAAQFAATYPGPGPGPGCAEDSEIRHGLRRLILSSSPASMELFERGCARLVGALPREVRETLRAHEEAGTTAEKAYQDAVGVFYARHLCRLDPMPAELVRSFECLEEDPTVYHTMNGPSEFHITGSLRTWTAIPSISSITSPTLLLSGAHDEVQEDAIQPFFDTIPRVKWVVLAESSHMALWEERERYIQVVRSFLK